MDQQKIHQLQQQYKAKAFDYAETPVKKWIAKALSKSINDVFIPEKDYSDELVINDNGHAYSIYLSTVNKGNNFSISKDIFLASDRLKSAVSMIFDSVYIVFNAIVGVTHEQYHEPLKYVIPSFVEDGMYFKLTAAHSLRKEKQAIYNHLIKANEMLQHTQQVDKDELVHQQEQLTKIISELRDKLILITDEKITELDQLIASKSDKYKDGPYLYITVDHNIKEDTKLRRLPDVGPQYVDPDEDNLDVVQQLME